MSRRKNQIVYANRITEHALLKSAAYCPRGVRLACPEGKANRTILTGVMSNRECPSHIRVHASDTVEMRDYCVKAMLEPALTVSIILDGRVEGCVGGLPFVLDATEHPAGYLWSTNTLTRWSRDIHKNRHVRKVNVSVPKGWLGAPGSDVNNVDRSIADFLEGPLAIWPWVPSKRALALVEEILNPRSESAFLQKIQMEAHALDLLGEALASLLPQRGSDGTDQHQARQRAKAPQIRDYIEHHVDEGLSLQMLAKTFGMGVNSLQRTFKAAYGMTVMDYVRERRLMAARDALELDGLTISQAAHLAGYSNPSNFSTAFKRVLGMSPSELGK